MVRDLSGPMNEALAAAARGPFFPDWEFETLFGLTRDEVGEVAGQISTWSAASPKHRVAVGSAVNNLLGYPHGRDADWAAWLSVTPEQLAAAYVAWQASGHEA
ncbi:conserved hypothetical protein [uncultured Defluviicoccus sp.]|uniref:Uncharacterized protein n=1 Tax=metagenome TaxID=256318 RepID=A0A380TE39_9ZZZZ|nr:conserved hypothetical protein [uncultured Defluviicoccus sp.]